MPLTLHYLLGLFSIISRITSNFMGMRRMLVSWLSRLQYSCPSVRDRNPLERKWMQESKSAKLHLQSTVHLQPTVVIYSDYYLQQLSTSRSNIYIYSIYSILTHLDVSFHGNFPFHRTLLTAVSPPCRFWEKLSSHQAATQLREAVHHKRKSFWEVTMTNTRTSNSSSNNNNNNNNSGNNSNSNTEEEREEKNADGDSWFLISQAWLKPKKSIEMERSPSVVFQRPFSNQLENPHVF